jgi:Sulfotransferase family
MSGPSPDPGSVVPERLAAPGPMVIGATGGSGTRVVAGIVRDAGMFIGERLNAYEDDLDVADYLDRWINPYVAGAHGGPEVLSEAMAGDLRVLVEGHCASVPAATPWGWKEPRSIYLLRFWNETMPSVRFLHFLRDGRDMAFSENQQQLTKHGDMVLGDGFRKAKTPTRSIAVWTRVNLAAADYGERELGSRYLRVRFEDLCADPGGTVAQIYDHFGLEGDPEEAGAEVRPPDTLGRWELRRKTVIGELNATAEPALRRFGYL